MKKQLKIFIMINPMNKLNILRLFDSNQILCHGNNVTYNLYFIGLFEITVTSFTLVVKAPSKMFFLV